MRFFQSRASRLRDQLKLRQAELDERLAREADELRTRETIDAKNTELNHLRNLEAEKLLASDADFLNVAEQRDLQTRSELSDATVVQTREVQDLQMRSDLRCREEFDRSDFTAREEHDLLMRDDLRNCDSDVLQTRHLDEIRTRGADNLRAREVENLRACGVAVPVVERRVDTTPFEKTTYVVRDQSSAGWAFAFVVMLIAAGVGFMALNDLSSKQSRTESAMMELRQQLAEQRIDASDSSFSQGLAPAVPGAQIPAPESNELLSQDDIVKRSMQPSRNPAVADMPPPTGAEPTALPARIYGPQPAPLAANTSQPVY